MYIMKHCPPRLLLLTLLAFLPFGAQANDNFGVLKNAKIIHGINDARYAGFAPEVGARGFSLEFDSGSPSHENSGEII